MKKPVENDPAAPLAPVFSRKFRVDEARDRKVTKTIEADEAERAALADFLGLPAIASLTATFVVAPLSRGRVEATGEVVARLTQTCVVTLADFETIVREPVEAIFSPPPDTRPEKIKGKVVADVSLTDPDDESDLIVDGRIDLGVLAAEYLSLGLDPWPRKPDAAFEEPAGGAESVEPSPFAALAKLRRSDGGEP